MRKIIRKRQWSIVPDMMKAQGMRFFDEKGVEKTSDICSPIERKPDIPNFQPPFLMIDTFAKQTSKPIKIVLIQTMEELKQLGFIICVLKTPGEFRSGQKVTYRLTYKDSPIYNSRVLGYVPTDHAIEKDINNNKIRMRGRNAGKFGYCKWIDIK